MYSIYFKSTITEKYKFLTGNGWFYVMHEPNWECNASCLMIPPAIGEWSVD